MNATFTAEVLDVSELCDPSRPYEVAAKFADLGGLLVFDDADARVGGGRGVGKTVVTAGPLVRGGIGRVTTGCDPFAACREAMGRFGDTRTASTSTPDVAGDLFVGGVAGVSGYEVGSAFEAVGRPERDPLAVPDLTWGLYDWGLTLDPSSGRATLGVAASGASTVAARVRDVIRRLESSPAEVTGPADPPRSNVGDGDEVLPGWRGDFTRPAYEAAVAEMVEAINAGEIFQVNLSQRLTRPFGGAPLALAATLAEVDPAPHAGVAMFDDWAVVSASPERFLRVEGRDVVTEPIKGTLPATADAAARLAASEKDRAENVMIVDLLRNDLSRVCEPDSVTVPSLCRTESFRHVEHLISTVRGRLHATCDVWDLLTATLPGGSISGAPKIRAMELIAAAEPVVRGPYCGQLFRYGFDGVFESNILIRTAVLRHGVASVSVGGGITTASDPAAEYEETLTKAAGLVKAFDACERPGRSASD
ncbi:MAG: anthranilate synthase component I family protein [Planctomycetota bacterium]